MDHKLYEFNVKATIEELLDIELKLIRRRTTVKENYDFVLNAYIKRGSGDIPSLNEFFNELNEHFRVARNIRSVIENKVASAGEAVDESMKARNGINRGVATIVASEFEGIRENHLSICATEKKKTRAQSDVAIFARRHLA